MARTALHRTEAEKCPEGVDQGAVRDVSVRSNAGEEIDVQVQSHQRSCQRQMRCSRRLFAQSVGVLAVVDSVHPQLDHRRIVHTVPVLALALVRIHTPVGMARCSNLDYLVDTVVDSERRWRIVG